jgi:hypothetical protein
MRHTVVIAALLPIAIADCASVGHPDRIPTQQELVGAYSLGDGLGLCHEVQLRADGTFSGTNCGGEHIGRGSSEFGGIWSLTGATLMFQTSGKELGQAEAFYWHGVPAFVEVRFKRGDRVEPVFVFERQQAK